MTTVPLTSSFVGIARIIAELTPLVVKAIKAIKPIIEICIKAAGAAKALAAIAASPAMMLFLNALNSGLSTFMILKQEEIQAYDIKAQQSLASGVQDAFTRSINNSIQIKTLQKLTQNLKLSDQRTRDRVYSLEKQQVTIRENINNTLYEVRQGRKNIDAKIAEQAKQFTAVKVQVDGLIKAANQNINQQIDKTIAEIKSTVAQANKRIETANKTITEQAKTITSLNTFKAQIPRTIERVSNLSQNATAKLAEAIAPTARVAERWGVTVTPATITPATVTVSDGGAIQVREFIAKPATVTPARFSSSAIGTEINDLIRQSTDRISVRFDAQGIAINAVGDVARIAINAAQAAAQTAAQAKQLAGTRVLDPRIDNLAERVREREVVDTRVEAKIDKLTATVNTINPTVNQVAPTIQRALPGIIAAFVPVIAAGVVTQVRPLIPSISQIGSTVGDQLCSNKCIPNAINSAADKIKDNTNKGTEALLKALDPLTKALGAASDLASLALLPIINNKLGDQVEGGISGKLGKAVKWLQLDRVLNVLTFAATVHNGFQLSSDIAMTLGQALSNVLSVIGIKDENDSPINVGELINGSVSNVIKSIVGEEQYNQISQAWAKANRIYAATTNVINSFSDIGNTLLDGLENIGGMNGKIGNALRIWGAVGEKAYEWFNPAPNYKFKFLNRLQNYQQGANTVLQVTQVPVDFVETVTEFNESTTEFIKAVKEEPGRPQGMGTPEAQQVKQQREEAKASSLGTVILQSDIFNAND